MDRILILMSATDFTDAQTALYSALENAAAPSSLSFGLTLATEPDPDSEAAMAALGRVQFLCPAHDAWAAMPSLWQGEGHVLMAHPAMRFTRGWDKSLMKQLRRCGQKRRKRVSLTEKVRSYLAPEDEAPQHEAQPVRAGEPDPEASPAEPVQHVLTGYLPVREDPLDAICPVGANALNLLGEMTFHHGMPMRYSTVLHRGPFLHPDFCFGPAGFFRAIAEGDEAEPMFLRAFREDWALYTPVKPAIRLVWDLPVPGVTIDPETDLAEEFYQTFGVDLANGVLSPQSRRGMVSADLTFRLRVPLRVKMRHRYRRWTQERLQNAGKFPTPQCITMYTGDMHPETRDWLRRLSALRELPLTAYVDPLLVREITEFLPNVRELKPRYLIKLPMGTVQEQHALSKASILANARDRALTPSHHIWLDADCVQYPLYAGTAFQWERLCDERIHLAVVGGVPDATMFVVPERLMLTLARETEARCLTYINQRGLPPTEAEVWSILIKEHPDWFQLHVMPVERQLFTLLDGDE